MLSVRTLNAPFFDVLKSPTRNATPLFSGTLSSQTSSIATLFAAAAQAALSVAVVNGETPLCSGTVDSTGRWSCRPQKALSDGSYLLVAVLTDGKGHFSGPSMARAVVIDTTPPNAPVLDLLASPSRKHRPVLSGTAEAASAVTVTDAGTGAALCEASANGAGAFSCRPERELAAGFHQFSATATDAAGNVSLPAVPVGVTISDVAPPPPTIDSPADGARRAHGGRHHRPGDPRWRRLCGASRSRREVEPAPLRGSALRLAPRLGGGDRRRPERQRPRAEHLQDGGVRRGARRLLERRDALAAARGRRLPRGAAEAPRARTGAPGGGGPPRRCPGAGDEHGRVALPTRVGRRRLRVRRRSASTASGGTALRSAHVDRLRRAPAGLQIAVRVRERAGGQPDRRLARAAGAPPRAAVGLGPAPRHVLAAGGPVQAAALLARTL